MRNHDFLSGRTSNVFHLPLGVLTGLSQPSTILYSPPYSGFCMDGNLLLGEYG